MYTAPTALISLVVLLPVLAGLAAVYYSHVNLALATEWQSERARAARIAALIIAGEIAHNATLQSKINSSSLTQADLEWLSRLASTELKRVTGVPYTVDVYISASRPVVVLGGGGYLPSQEAVGSWSYTPGANPRSWHYEAVSLPGGLVVVVGAGV
ncbi:MAG: hypothetical protein F7C34_03380 [Desulfurococcales archaeon]|nr:hypothetical protein [Desulfurococcales archaeon]